MRLGRVLESQQRLEHERRPLPITAQHKPVAHHPGESDRFPLKQKQVGGLVPVVETDPAAARFSNGQHLHLHNGKHLAIYQKHRLDDEHAEICRTRKTCTGCAS